jgi:outer membrane protein TolC
LSVLLIFNVLLSNLYGQVLNLDSIIRQIDKNFPELQMYDEQIKAYDSYATGAKSWEAPQIGTGFFMTPYNAKFWKANEMGSTGIPNPGMGTYMIQIQQMIPNPSKLKANQKYMNQMSSVEKENKNAMRNELISEAKDNYYSWLILKKKQKVLLDMESIMKYIIESSEMRYSYQQEKLNSIYKAKSELLKINNMQVMVENDMKEKMIVLNRLMNRNTSDSFTIDTNYSIQDYEKQLVDTSMLVKTRSDIKAIERNIQLTSLKQRYEATKAKPDFGIRYDHMFSFGQNPNLFSLMGMVSIPIAPWSSKMYKANKIGLSYEMKALQKQKESIVNEASGELKLVQTQILNKKRQVDLYEKGIIPALKKNYRITLLAYEQNTEELFMVLDAVQNLQMTQLEYLSQLQELLQLQVKYEKQIEKL